MAYRDEIDHSRGDARSAAAGRPSETLHAAPGGIRGIWGGIAAVVGLLVILFVALSFVGGDEGASSSVPGDGMIAPAEAPPAPAEAPQAPADSAPATVPAE